MFPFFGFFALAGILLAGLLSPAVLGAGALSNQVSDAVSGVSAQLEIGNTPAVTTVTDRNGTPIATLYDQYRLPLTAAQISPTMKSAIVAVEDRRF